MPTGIPMLRAFTFLAACIPAVAVCAAQQHPRLFATAERLAAIKAQPAVPGSFHQQADMAMKARVDAPDWKSRYEETRKYQHGSNTAFFIPGFMAREAALLALLTDNPQEQTRYATQAHDALKGIDYLGSSVLNRATQAMSLALAYDWLYNIWTEQQRAAMTETAIRVLDKWPLFEHANFGDRRASNFTGVCRGGEMQGVAQRDPTGKRPAAVGDDRGHYFFRNRWQDRDDIQVSVMADTHHVGHAWDQPEPLALNLMAHDTRYIGGPGKRRENSVYSALLVDGRYNITDAPALPGEVVAFEPGARGGYAIVGGGALYRALGVDEMRRHLLVDFALPENGAVIATLDRVRSAAEHTYVWQANIGDEDGADSVRVTAGDEAGRPTFLLKGRREGFVKGWVLAPANARVTAGDPLQIAVQARDADIIVVMLLGKGKPPVATVKDNALTVAGKTIGVDAATGRIACR